MRVGEAAGEVKIVIKRLTKEGPRVKKVNKQLKMHMFAIIRGSRGSEGGWFTSIRVLQGLEGGRR